jgi:membrane-bound serine protease (ClpP class)
MGDFQVQLFTILLIAGLMFVGAEVFVPGGVLGILGGICLIGAVIAAFTAFTPTVAAFISVLIIILVGVVIVMWIKFFPKSKIGRQMTATRDLASSKATEDGLSNLLGKDGEALSDLRPGGFARIDGHRVDVVTQGGMISRGERITVVEVEGNRVVVRKVDTQATT